MNFVAESDNLLIVISLNWSSLNIQNSICEIYP